MNFNWATRSILNVWETPHGYVPRFAWIHDQKINDLADVLAKQNLVTPSWRETGIFPEDDRLFVAHTFLFNTSNAYYASVDPPHEKYERQLSESVIARGSMAYAAAFTLGLSHFDTPKEWTERILHITDSKVLTENFFRGITPLPLLGERRVHLNTAVRVLREKYQSDPRHILEEAKWRAFGPGAWKDPKNTQQPGIVELLLRDFSPVFDDSDTIILGNGSVHPVHFLKLAQLWPMMLYGRACAPGSTLHKIADPESIGPIADYVVPNTLRSKGLLFYEQSLAERIDARIEIPASSVYEIEIRMATTAVMAFLAERVNCRINGMNFHKDKISQKPSVTMAEIDYALWSLGRGLKTPHHLTQTMRY